MATITPTDLALAGVVRTLAAVNASDSIASVGNDQNVFLEVANASGGSINVTIAKKTSIGVKNVPGYGPLTVADQVIAVANGAAKIIGPFPDDYIQADGSVTASYSGTTSVTAAAFRCKRIDRP